MAAALIPLIAGLAPEIINLIVGLVHQKAPVAEAELGAGTGPVKFAQVFGDVINALGQAAQAGTINKALPPDDTIKTIIQAAIASMQLSGVLGPAAFPPAPAAQSVTLKAGQSLLVTA